MDNKLAAQDLEDKLVVIKKGLHLAMDHLINRREYAGAEDVLRQVDVRLTELIDNIRAQL